MEQQLRLLRRHHLGQQLVLEALLGHDKIDQRALRRELGRVVRVAQLGGDVEPEVLRVVELLVAEPDRHAVPDLDDGLGQPMAELLGGPAGVAKATSLAGLGGIDGLVEGLGQPIGELLVELTGVAVAEMSGRGGVSLMMDLLASLVGLGGSNDLDLDGGLGHPMRELLVQVGMTSQS